MNRQAIALAADSAVTIGRQRVWKYSNKLFSLGPTNDIAVMVYGTGEFAGFPWETIVKTFRSECGGTKFDTVQSCADRLVLFLEDERFVPDLLNRQMHFALLIDQIEDLGKKIPKYVKKADFRKFAEEVSDEKIEEYKKFPQLINRGTYKKFLEEYDLEMIKNFSSELLKESIPERLVKKIARMLYEFTIHEVCSNYSSGLVVAGYGDKEFFPVVLDYVVDGKDSTGLRCWVNHIYDLTIDDIRKTIIIPFAQSDIFHLFMEGISPEYISFLNYVLLRVLDDKSERMVRDYVVDPDEKTVELSLQKKDNLKIIEKFSLEFDKYRDDSVVRPILDVVRALPKEEMANMALALVELTSLRRKVDSPIESVGGPVDVAVISKGDGLIWVRRKHYFDLDKNRDFLYRKDAKRGKANGEGN